MLEMFRRYELSRDAWFELKAECDRLGIAFLSTPQNRSDLELLLELGISAIKVGSDDFTNLPLPMEDYASAGLPLILSCGDGRPRGGAAFSGEGRSARRSPGGVAASYLPEYPTPA